MLKQVQHDGLVMHDKVEKKLWKKKYKIRMKIYSMIFATL